VRGEHETQRKKGRIVMLYTLAVVLILLWLVGELTSYTLGGLIHALLVIAVVAVLLRIISGRKPM
jgi:multidrug efflux pump subunit AcrB